MNPRWLMLVLLGALGGCAADPGVAGPPARFAVESGRYEEAFEAAKAALVRGRFELDRVDARAGVITTLPKRTNGLASPWDTEQTTFRQEVEEFLNQQMRTARITFEIADDPAAPPEPLGQAAPAPAPVDLRRLDAPLTARVEVVLERVRRTGWRVETTSIRRSSFSLDPQMIARGIPPRHSVPFSLDPLLAERLARQIEAGLAGEP